MLKRISTSLVLATILALVLAACGGEPQSTPTPSATLAPTRRPVIVPTLVPGWTPYSRSTYQIALPGSWEEVKLSEEQLKNTIAAAQEDNPPLAEQLRALLESGQYDSYLFYGVDKNNGAIARNVSITDVGLEGTNDLQSFAESYAAALPNVVRGSKVIETQSPLRVNGIDAVSLTYDVPLVDGAGNLVTLRGVQFLFMLESGDAYLVTVTGDASEADAFEPLARQIATSFVAITP